MPIYKRTFLGRPEEIGKARAWTRAILKGTPHADNAALVVTELGSNAVLHTASGSENGTFHVWLTQSGDSVTITVADRGATDQQPHVETPPDDVTHGRGLTLVTAVAQTVEVHGNKYGHTITAHLTAAVPQSDTASLPTKAKHTSDLCRALWLSLRGTDVSPHIIRPQMVAG